MFRKCKDIDECKDDPNLCEANLHCLNSPGNYTCDCRKGYKNNGTDCLDVDERRVRHDSDISLTSCRTLKSAKIKKELVLKLPFAKTMSAATNVPAKRATKATSAWTLTSVPTRARRCTVTKTAIKTPTASTTTAVTSVSVEMASTVAASSAIQVRGSSLELY